MSSKLNPKQYQTIEMLLAGKTAVDIANALGIDRGTIARWRTGDADFIAEYNSQRNAILSAYQERIMRLGGKALEVLETEMDKKTAMEILRLLRLGDVFERDRRENAEKIKASWEREARFEQENEETEKLWKMLPLTK